MKARIPCDWREQKVNERIIVMQKKNGTKTGVKGGELKKGRN